MKKWILILLLMCSILAQDEYSQQMQQFLENVKNDNVKEGLSYLESIGKKDKEEIEFAMLSFLKHKEIFSKENNKSLSQTLCSVILELLKEKKIENDLQIAMFNILIILNTDVVLSFKEDLFDLIDVYIGNTTNCLASNFFENFILQKKINLPDIAALIAKNNNIDSEIVRKVLIKYSSEYFWEKIVENLQQNGETIGFSIILALECSLEIDYLDGIKLTTLLFQSDKNNTLNRETKEYCIYILEEGIRKYIKNNDFNTQDKRELFISIFKLAEKNSKEISDFLLQICFEFQREIFVEQNINEISLLMSSLILEQIKAHPLNRESIEMLLSIDSKILIPYKSELENIFSKNVETLSPCLAKLILKEEKFIDFYPILLNSPHNYNLYYTVFLDIYEKYGEKLFPYCEQGLKGSKLTKKRVIYSALYSQNQGNDFLTRYFVEIFHNLHLFHHTHPPTNELRELIKKVGVENILDLIISDKINTDYYSFHRDYEEEIVTALKNVLRDDNFTLLNHPYLENLSKSRFGIRKGIIEDKNINLRRNLLQIIYESKVDEYDAIITVLKYLSDPELEEKAKNIVTRFSRKKIHNALDIRGRSEYCDFNEEEVNLIKQKLVTIFGEDFFTKNDEGKR